MEHDDKGQLTGLAQDSAQQLVVPSNVKVGHHGPDIGYDIALAELTDDIARACQSYLAAGITSVVDAQVTQEKCPAISRHAIAENYKSEQLACISPIMLRRLTN